MTGSERDARALLRGAGWGLSGGAWEAPDEVRSVELVDDSPGATLAAAAELDELLARLDALASSGDPNRVALGFLTYEAGVLLEGSTPLVRPPERTPLAWFAFFDARRARPEAPSDGAGPRPRAVPRAAPPTGVLGRDAHARGVEAIREAIARGDVYQVNLTRRLAEPVAAEPFALAEALFADNPVPFALTLSTPRWAVVANSPELFLDVDLPHRRAESRPIKGTVVRSAARDDDAARAALLASEKDAAEHVMIVDLVRNDLGRVAEPGGVSVPRLRAATSWAHVHHLESTVVAALRRDAALSDVLRATLPAGSITGAPKRASLRLIRALEPCARGPYTGAIGTVRGDGRAVFAVGIRTAVVSAAGAEYHAGGGIVWDSDADAEWAETEAKSEEFQRAVRGAARSGAEEPARARETAEAPAAAAR